MNRKAEKDVMTNIYTAIQALQDAQMYLENAIDNCEEKYCNDIEFTCYECVSCNRALRDIQDAIIKIQESFTLSGLTYKVHK